MPVLTGALRRLPVGILTLFVLGLAGWVGYTIATIQVEVDPAPEILSTEPASEGDNPAGDPA